MSLYALKNNEHVILNMLMNMNMFRYKNNKLSFKCFIKQYAGENESIISLLLKYY